eukprot:jgi/Chrzof1/11712/Cz06g06150.t1
MAPENTLKRQITIDRKLTHGLQPGPSLVRTISVMAHEAGYEEAVEDLHFKGVSLLVPGVVFGIALAYHFWRLVVLPWRQFVFAVIMLTEVLFYFLYYRRRYLKWNAQPDVHAPSHLEALRLFQRFIKLETDDPEASTLDIVSYLTVWFKDAAIEDIKRGNVEELMAYGFWYKTRDQMIAEGLGHIPSEMVSRLEEVWHLTFEPGYNSNIEFMGHLWEDLRVTYRPLSVYLVTELMSYAGLVILTSLGFKTITHEGIRYYTYGLCDPQAPGSTTTTGPRSSGVTPVVFLHGVRGLPLYIELLKHVAELGNPILAPEYRHVALRLCGRIPRVDELTNSLIDVMDAHRIRKALVVGHSYGTFIASVLSQKHRDRLHSLCLIDPVCFCIFMPHLLHNFIYRLPRFNLMRPEQLFRDFLFFFASHDIHLSATFARQFYWTDLNLWPEDMPTGSVVLLSGADELVNGETVRDMLEKSGIKVLFNPNLWHGAFLLDARTKQGLVGEIGGLLRTSTRLMTQLAAPMLEKTLTAVGAALGASGWQQGHHVLRSMTDSVAAYRRRTQHEPYPGHEGDVNLQPGGLPDTTEDSINDALVDELREQIHRARQQQEQPESFEYAGSNGAPYGMKEEDHYAADADEADRHGGVHHRQGAPMLATLEEEE